jgi:hypothetical protein
MDKQIYLGDGVYAAFEAPLSQIWLSTPRPEGEHRIAIDRQVWDNLREYAQQVWAPKRPPGGSAIER